jgi:hypothetical protein
MAGAIAYLAIVGGLATTAFGLYFVLRKAKLI